MDIVNIHRYLAGEATPEEKEELERWLDVSEKNRKTFESYKRIYDVEIQHQHTYNTAEALTRFRQVMDEDKSVRSLNLPRSTGKPKRKQRGIWWKAAAVLLISAGLYVYIFSSDGLLPGGDNVERVAGTTISTLPGEQKSFRLQDGSRVRLNAGSEMYIPEGFGTDKREVRLTGEAFFEVVSLDGLSFEVQTATARIEVLGTSFGIRAWQGREESVIAVQSGRVSVRSVNLEIAETTILEPGEYSRVELDQAPSPAYKDNIEQFTGWIRQIFVFEETPLKDALRQLELHFNVTIEVSDSSNLGDPVTARYREESLQEILDYTSITHDLSFTIQSTP